MSFQYPSLISRTLDPSGKSLRTVVGLHDHEITDADINLIQDLQDYKRGQVLGDMVSSGCLTYAPLQFNQFNPNTFSVPAFDVLFQGQVITIAGNNSTDLGLNRVQLPVPATWAQGTAEEDARLYVVFLEIWYQSLNPITGQGYYQDPITKLYYYFPYGCVNPSAQNAELVPDDSTDPFQGLFTTERAQVQWTINVQRVGLNYDFSKYKFGLDPDTTGSNPYAPMAVYAQTSLPDFPVYGISPLNGIGTYQFQYMGSGTTASNGDTGLWRAGDGNVNNSLGTMDGYSYAMPVAVVFQRNYGYFDLATNVFGCANPNIVVGPTGGTNGLLSSGVSGRFDYKLADQVFRDDAVDTRSIVQLQGTDYDQTMRDGFGDLVTGHTQLAIVRGIKQEALGAELEWYVLRGPTASLNTAYIGPWDGWSNGFGADQRTFSTTVSVPTSAKTNGNPAGNWSVNDAFALSLPSTSSGLITSVDVTALVGDPVAGTKTPAALLQGQYEVAGLGSGAVTVTLVVSLVGTAFDPGPNNLYVTLDVTYPAGSNPADLVQVPASLDGGLLFDHAVGRTMPAFGVSDYAANAPQPVIGAFQMPAINPQYSDVIFGTKVWLKVPGSAGVQSTVQGQTVTTFTLPCPDLNGNIGGLYCTTCWDFVTGKYYAVQSRTMTSVPPPPAVAGVLTTTVAVAGAVQPGSTVLFSLLAQNTAQVSYNAPVKAVTVIEETVLFGNYNADSNFPMDGRVVLESVRQPGGPGTPTTVVLGANGCAIKGISGDDVNRLVWVLDAFGVATAVQVPAPNFINGTVVVTVPGTVTIDPTQPNAQPFFFCGSILPALDAQSSLTLGLQYIPYQGEGVAGRTYEILHAEDNALVTTNGTGKAPVVGLADVYPYNRELPIITMLPAQQSWADSGLANDAVASFFDSNYVAMRADNVEHTFVVPLHTNDFIPPLNRDTRKTIQFSQNAQRGWGLATPHIGFAIQAPTARTVLGQNLQSTVAPITLYVDNASGSDSASGLSPATAKLTIGSALAQLPPVLRHPCTVILADTGLAFNVSQMQGALDVVALGDGDIRSSKVYCLGNLSRVIQDEGRLVVSRAASATNPVVIDCSGFSGFGDGPTCAFYIDTSRVILNGIRFLGFSNPVIIAYNADVDMVACEWGSSDPAKSNAQAGAYVGCDSVILDGGSTSLGDNAVGHVMTQSVLTSSTHALAAVGPARTPGVFYVADRNSTMVLQQHGPADEAGVLAYAPPAAGTVVAEAALNSSIFVTSTFQSAGTALLQANSVLSRTVVVAPFSNVVADASSSTVTQVG